MIISENPRYGSTVKPKELYDIIERFCLGRKRIELFGNQQNLRPGWLTLGKDLPSDSNFKHQAYNALFAEPHAHYVSTTGEIELLRPKSPTRMMGNRKKQMKKIENPMIQHTPAMNVNSNINMAPTQLPMHNMRAFRL